MKYLIVGIGNPGAEYENTRHNAGYMALDLLAGEAGAVFSPVRHAHRAEFRHKGRTLVLIKPTTYVNLSGKAVRYWLQKENIAPDHLLVVVDDLALPVGALRLRASGRDAGHNGLKDIQATLGHNNYARLRLGIGHDFNRGHQVDYVLGQFDAPDRDAFDQALVHATEAIKIFTTLGPERAMNLVNTKPKTPPPPGETALKTKIPAQPGKNPPCE